MPQRALFNILSFGSECIELFPMPFKNTCLNFIKALDFVYKHAWETKIY